ncbi:hypothetical protein ABZW10_04145 [Kitasatospora sp. NPDC004723]|uniref:hypothetical protein n=1 Tax=Kitasatospora sp. NPDC004723 TaxID=3154288 RepID=UPI0033A9C5EA
MNRRRVTATALAVIFAVGLLTAPAQAEPRPSAHRTDVQRAEAGEEEDGGRWLECHPHSFRDWCPLLGPEWHQKFWQYCDSVFGKQEYCVKTPPPTPADAALAPGD